LKPIAAATPTRHPTVVVEIRPAGIDDFSSLRYLHARALMTQAGEALSNAELEAFVRFCYSPAYADQLRSEHILAAWIGGELAGSAAWQPASADGATARIGSLFVRHPRFGIGRRLLAQVEALAAGAGALDFATFTTSNAVAFFERCGYTQTSRGVRALSPECALPITFLRKVARPLER
jgi:GNAT superfamily N-acetyltransferase